jgi:MFS family permease
MSNGAAVVVATDAIPTSSSVKTLFLRAPRDLGIAFAVLFIESYCMFNFFNVLMWMLTQEAGFGDRQSGWIYAAFGLQTAICTMLMGPVVDRILVRASLFLVLWLSLIVCVVLALLSPFHNAVLLVCLFVPLPIAIGLATPVVQIAIRRYTLGDSQTLAFALQYIFINIASACSQFTVDAYRLHLASHVPENRVWSLFIGCQAILHGVALVATWAGIRNIQVLESGDLTLERGKWVTEPVTPTTTSATTMVSSVGTALRDGKFWRLAVLCVSVIGAKAVFVFLYTIYPLYMLRAPYDPPGETMPFMAFLALDPVICIFLAWLVATLVNRRHWERYWVIFAGTCIVGASPFLMIPYSYFGVLAFIVVEAIGESIWAPLFLRYSCEFTPSGREGVYFGLVGIVLFLGKLLGGVSGELLQQFCPDALSCASQGYLIWIIVGGICCSTPVLLLLTMRWTWLKSLTVPVVEPVVMSASQDTEEEEVENKVDDFTCVCADAASESDRHDHYG